MIDEKSRFKFSNSKPFRELLGQDPVKLAEHWKVRIEDYYLIPARKLNDEELGFAAVNILCAAIEAIATILHHDVEATGARFKIAARELLDIDDRYSELVYLHYRCGLTHNGRTNQSVFSDYRQHEEISGINYHVNELLTYETLDGVGYLQLNPVMFSDRLDRAFSRLFSTRDSKRSIGRTVRIEFEADLIMANKVESKKAAS